MTESPAPVVAVGSSKKKKRISSPPVLTIQETIEIVQTTAPIKECAESPYRKLMRERQINPKKPLSEEELLFIKRATRCNETNKYTLDIARLGLSELHIRLLKAS